MKRTPFDSTSNFYIPFVSSIIKSKFVNRSILFSDRSICHAIRHKLSRNTDLPHSWAYSVTAGLGSVTPLWRIARNAFHYYLDLLK